MRSPFVGMSETEIQMVETVDKRQCIQQCHSDILSAQCSSLNGVAPDRESTTREKTEIMPTTSTVAPERAFKPRRKREIF